MTIRYEEPHQVLRGGGPFTRICTFVSAAERGSDKPDSSDLHVSFRSHLPLRAPR